MSGHFCKLDDFAGRPGYSVHFEVNSRNEITRRDLFHSTSLNNAPMSHRPAFAFPRLDNTPAQHVSKRITIRHPAYGGQNNVLISLLAADGPQGGLNLMTAHTISGIIADNRFDGYLARESDPTSAALHVQILPPGEYFFHVPSNTAVIEPGQVTAESSPSAYCYPIVAFFDSWTFPHMDFPILWRTTTYGESSVLRPTNTAVLERDRTCRLTNQRLGCELAHVVPKSEETWFLRNGMGMQYGSLGRREASDKLDEPENVMLLRSDIHKAWDDRSFVFLPKPNLSSSEHGTEYQSAATGDCSYVAHVMHQDEEMIALFHNVKSQALGVRPEYLFARLAWSILPATQNFLSSGEPRLLKVWNGNSGTMEVRWFTGKDCGTLLQSRKRSRSPTKRARSGGATEDESSARKKWRRCSTGRYTCDSFDSGIDGFVREDVPKHEAEDHLDRVSIGSSVEHGIEERAGHEIELRGRSWLR